MSTSRSKHDPNARIMETIERCVAQEEDLGVLEASVSRLPYVSNSSLSKAWHTFAVLFWEVSGMQNTYGCSVLHYTERNMPLVVCDCAIMSHYVNSILASLCFFVLLCLCILWCESVSLDDLRTAFSWLMAPLKSTRGTCCDLLRSEDKGTKRHRCWWWMVEEDSLKIRDIKNAL